MPRRPPLLACGRWPWRLLPVWLIIMFFLLPYDSTLRLSVRFVTLRAFNILGATSSLETSMGALVNNPSLNIGEPPSLGIIVKTGYGTRHRVPAQLRALGVRPDTQRDNVVIVADYAGRLDYSPANSDSSGTAVSILVHDVIAPVLSSRAVTPHIHDSSRVKKYRSLAEAIRKGNDAEAQSISRDVGWELDAMKVCLNSSRCLSHVLTTDTSQFIPGLELAHSLMPHKDWYLLIDDDTFVIPPSLRLFLTSLDPARPLYAGNAIGDFRARFAHGGSAVLLSRAAVTQLLDAPSRAAVHRAYVDSLTEVWGDKLLATTLMRVGVYLDERFTHFFNGGRPRATRISADRFCLPLISFHGLADPAGMAEVGSLLGSTSANPDATDPLLWGDLWALFHRPTIAALRQKPLRAGCDFVGRPGDDSSSVALASASTANITSAEVCRALCESTTVRNGCLAWTWMHRRRPARQVPGWSWVRRRKRRMPRLSRPSQVCTQTTCSTFSTDATSAAA